MSDAISGESVLKQAMRARIKNRPAGLIARDLSISIEALEAWATGSAKLQPTTLDLIAKYVFGDNCYLDPASGLLKRTPRPSTRGPVPPPPFPRKTEPAPKMRWPFYPPDKAPPPPPPKPGWATD